MSGLRDYYRENPQKVEHLPTQPFFVILVEDSYCTEDYGQTSRHDILKPQVYETEGAWKAEIAKLSEAKGYNAKKFKAMKVYPAEVSVEVKVHVDTPREEIKAWSPITQKYYDPREMLGNGGMTYDNR
jgi:Tfp pilus assembly protein PilP